MGKCGVLWGRLVTMTKEPHSVIYRRNRTIYRRQVADFNTRRDAVGFLIGNCIRVTGTKRHSLVISGRYIRKESKFNGAIVASRRGCDGIRTDTLFPIKKNRDRQVRTNSVARFTSYTRFDFRSGLHPWCRGSFRNNESQKVGRSSRRKTIQTSRVHGTCEKTDEVKKGFERVRTYKRFLMHSRAAGQSSCDASWTTQLTCGNYMQFSAKNESRMTQSGESASTDARH